MRTMFFKDRRDAGIKLAGLLNKFKGKDAVVYALPRGGVITGYEIAKALAVPLDLAIAKKIGHPFNPEYAVCAVAEGENLVCSKTETQFVSKEWLGKEVKKVEGEILKRKKAYLGKIEPISPKGKIAILVDDGIATGLTMRAAILWAKSQKSKKIVAAVPVSPKDTAHLLKAQADEFYALDITDFFLGSVGAYYENFEQISDEEVMRFLNEARNNLNKK